MILALSRFKVRNGLEQGVRDVRMPVMDGLETCRRIKESLSDDDYLPVRLVSGLAERQDHTAGLAAGAVEFLGKPIDQQEAP